MPLKNSRRPSSRCSLKLKAWRISWRGRVALLTKTHRIERSASEARISIRSHKAVEAKGRLVAMHRPRTSKNQGSRSWSTMITVQFANLIDFPNPRSIMRNHPSKSLRSTCTQSPIPNPTTTLLTFLLPPTAPRLRHPEKSSTSSTNLNPLSSCLQIKAITASPWNSMGAFSPLWTKRKRRSQIRLICLTWLANNLSRKSWGRLVIKSVTLISSRLSAKWRTKIVRKLSRTKLSSKASN